jgi:hypothetical protein
MDNKWFTVKFVLQNWHHRALMFLKLVMNGPKILQKLFLKNLELYQIIQSTDKINFINK